jgi:DNA-directed RNA polymerase subunit K/omega
MAIQTLDLEKIETITTSIYEACLVIARRARQINGERISKRKEKEIMEDTGFDQEFDTYDREFLEGIEYEREINPTVEAQEELLEGKLSYHYLTENDFKEDILPS